MPEPFDQALPGLGGPDVGVHVAPVCRGHVSACRECGAPIVWAMTDQHRPMPVNVTPDERGNVELTATRGGLHCVVVGRSERGDHRGDRHLSHFATCPQAAKVRKPRRAPNGPTARN